MKGREISYLLGARTVPVSSSPFYSSYLTLQIRNGVKTSVTRCACTSSTYFLDVSSNDERKRTRRVSKKNFLERLSRLREKTGRIPGPYEWAVRSQTSDLNGTVTCHSSTALRKTHNTHTYTHTKKRKDRKKSENVCGNAQDRGLDRCRGTYC